MRCVRLKYAILLLALAVCALVIYLLVRPYLNVVNLAGLIGTAEAAVLEIPAGFTANVFAADLDGPRFIRFGPDGSLYVADRGDDRIVRLTDSDGDGVADQRQVFADQLDRPHSLVYHRGSWLVGVPSGVVRLTDADGDGRAEQRQALIDDYPTGGHSTRTVEVLPDGRMVVSIGSSCNVCDEDDPRRATVMVYADDQGTGGRIFARGLRNAVGLALQPGSGALWAVNNGRDMLGDDLPPEALYRLQEGADYGWPRCHNGTIEDPDFGAPGSCAGVALPELNMQAHSAPLGLVFYDGVSFPAEYRGDLFIAFHGSWNRSEPTGYKVVRVPFASGRPVGQVVDFASGWRNPHSGDVAGRPVGLAVGPDGALYVSDDKADRIYRIQAAE